MKINGFIDGKKEKKFSTNSIFGNTKSRNVTFEPFLHAFQKNNIRRKVKYQLSEIHTATMSNKVIANVRTSGRFNILGFVDELDSGGSGDEANKKPQPQQKGGKSGGGGGSGQSASAKKRAKKKKAKQQQQESAEVCIFSFCILSLTYYKYFI